MGRARLLHTMLRVRNLDVSLDFYTSVLGMRLLRQKTFPQRQFTLAFVGYGEETDTAVLELTHNWGRDQYEIGTAYGHIAIGVEDVFSAVRAAEAAGAKVTRPAGPLQGDPSEMIAFIEDPDGYKVELIQRE
ncbi:MAG TPA: lactoylglutathione lyase [Noviherbaspirillum sp.]|nr:lactoylglutathione lyase [Noviherbaspirillum sp.]